METHRLCVRSAGAVSLASVLLLACVSIRLPAAAAGGVAPQRCLVWGPGLETGAVLPVRYFFIQAVGADGRNLSESPGADTFQVRVSSLGRGEHVRIQAPPPLDRGDGSFLFRFRLYGSVSSGLKIQVLLGDAHVARSPYEVKGPVYHEYCDCPEPDGAAWQRAMSCPPHQPQILSDLLPFPSVDLQRLRLEAPRRFSNRGGLIHYTIVQNRLYRHALGRYTDFKMFSDEALLSLLRKVRVPDVEFFMNVGDWPLESSRGPDPVPVFSWCGSTDSRDIVLPTYELTHSTLETLRGVTNDLLSVQGHTGPVWANKSERAFFRGRDSRAERLLLASMSQSNPELLDAAITGWFFFREREKLLGRAPLVGFFDFFKYKYQVSVDGTVAAYRFPYLMLGDSLVLKQESPYYEFFYSSLGAGRHFLPLRRNLSDLLDTVRWARGHDGAARQVARAGQEEARRLLEPTNIYCYYYGALLAYGARQLGRPTAHTHMEPVTERDATTPPCSCERGSAGPPGPPGPPPQEGTKQEL